MAEGFGPYHVPQQSRRDKLRVIGQSHPGCVDNLQGCTGLGPFYDPSLVPADLLTCANFHHQNHPLGGTCKPGQDPNAISDSGSVKEEGLNFMGYVGGMIAASSSSSTTHTPFMDPQSSVQLNPTSIQELSSNPFLYASQNLRVLDQHPYSVGGEVVIYRPEPLSVGHGAYTTGQELSLELNLQRYESPMFGDKVSNGGYTVPGIVGGGSTESDLSRNTVPLGPFTGYASILKESRFLKPAQQLLEELCDVGRGIYAAGKIHDDSGHVDHPFDHLSSAGIVDDLPNCDGEPGRKKSRLITLLDEVYRRYKQYYQQMQAVVASFESVAGLSNAAPFANLAFKTMYKHFKCLKNVITDQLQFTTKSYGKDDGADRQLYNSQRTVQNSGFVEHQPVWRPQRGLPERAVTVLRAWLFEHFLHPYPTDTDKQILAKQTGLSRNQVSNWFINARVRLWKPMVEEIHMLETRQAQKGSSQREEQHNTHRANDHLHSTNSFSPENPSTSTQRTQDFPSKRSRNDFPDVLMGNGEPMHLQYGNLSQHQNPNTGGGGGGVSLTLGLHQNNGLGLSDQFPMNAARRFGLDSSGDGYVLGGFQGQNRQFGRDILGGQLLHDFVG